MNVLLLGSGGRESAIAYKISQSKLLDRLFISSGNAGTVSYGTNINDFKDFAEMKSFVLEKNIEMVVVGPEEPLTKGIADWFHNDLDLKNVLVVGPQRRGAMLEASKD